MGSLSLPPQATVCPSLATVTLFCEILLTNICQETASHLPHAVPTVPHFVPLCDGLALTLSYFTGRSLYLPTQWQG